MDGAQDSSAQAKYVASFEDALSKVNGIWLTEWTRQRDTRPAKTMDTPKP